ncbi:hypothetical protein [Desulfuribacillus alkaliarsenatis]|uniref:Uncharacterized protein n=1 Tax=Desulfuribacillus alkaliarsenatis TaxID=766136 RepID=A0A1E5G477_9FIRM|nr:hypothetical protein [Desulfuribacillus alkaliarsenatis]OEF97469.1 hypothetical protein BHF68_04485 [Desulfuribacillus alkaliarsenatis]
MAKNETNETEVKQNVSVATDTEETSETGEKKKISLKDAIRQQLANKKQSQTKGNNANKSQDTKKMTHQNSKKNTIQRRKMGG